MFLQQAVGSGGKYKLWVLAIVGHASLEGESVVGLICQRDEDGVDAGGVGVEVQDMCLSVEARHRRGVQVDKQLLEVDIGGSLQDISHRVALLAADVEATLGQHCFQRGLVDGAALQLRADGVAEGCELVK